MNRSDCARSDCFRVGLGPFDLQLADRGDVPERRRRDDAERFARTALPLRDDPLVDQGLRQLLHRLGHIQIHRMAHEAVVAAVARSIDLGTLVLDPAPSSWPWAEHAPGRPLPDNEGDPGTDAGHGVDHPSPSIDATTAPPGVHPQNMSGATPLSHAATASSAALTSIEAQRLFDDVAADSRIPFDYPDDCCYSRAHLMCKTFSERGLPCGKVWNYASEWPDATLKADTPNHPDGFVLWRYHVAPTIPVLGAGGSVEHRVIDPSLAKAPLTLSQWKDLQQDPGSTLETTGSEPYYRGPGGSHMMTDSTYAQTVDRLAEHRLSRTLRQLERP